MHPRAAKILSTPMGAMYALPLRRNTQLLRPCFRKLSYYKYKQKGATETIAITCYHAALGVVGLIRPCRKPRDDTVDIKKQRERRKKRPDKSEMSMEILRRTTHGMQTRSSHESSVCPSVCPSNAWIVTKRERNLRRFLYHTKDHLA